MRVAIVVALLSLLPGSIAAHAADAAAGKVKADALCAACHGGDGVSRIADTPSLAGQPDQFIQWQLVFFRGGARKSDVMGPVAEQLDNNDIRNLGAYFAALPPPQGAADDNPDLSRKGEMAAKGRRCAACHTDSYAGTRA
ncbi:MAG: cytochrome c, partial [Xanthobacteraceae bacterium]